MIVDKSTKRVSVGNTEIQKIMSGGGIIWQRKIFTWRMYKLKNIYGERVKLISEDGIAIIPKNVILTSEDAYGLKWNGDVGYHIYGGYEIENSMYRIQYNLKGIKEKYIKNTEKGSYIEEIYSYSSDDYPKNGIKGEYWYELVE